MGKRQTRIFTKELKEFPSIVGLEVNVLLRNNTVFHGKLLQIDQQTLTLKDLRLKKHVLLLIEVEEIMIDKEAMY
jgi:ribosome maturation factor RimP